jgi:SAM-dependent methyltransferase
MSTPHTGQLTLDALRARGLRVTPLPVLTDVDTMADAQEVAAAAPATRFAAALGSFFDPALHGNECWLVDDDGNRETVPVRRWHGEPERPVREHIGRCDGPTLDIGCGPGRLAAALTARGVATLGIDTSTVAIDLTRRRGAAALRRDVFGPLPDEGRWRHVLLFDGNIGIGGAPVTLLRRCADLLEPGGSALVELAPPGTGLWRGSARLEHAGSAGQAGATGPACPWARLGADAVHAVAACAGLTVHGLRRDEDRWFAELVRP